MDRKGNIDETVNHLFRQESGKMVAVLVKIFGTENLEMVEDVVQDTLISALETWKFNGLPDQPSAWLYRTAKNKAIDIIRRRKHGFLFDFSDPEHQLLNSEYTLSTAMDNLWQNDEIQDDFLAMMFACCHPDLTPEQQVTLILKSLCGFSTKEIAKAFLTAEDTVSKRLYRTKEYFRKNKTRPEIPDATEIAERIRTVLDAIYLMFNEGYSSTHNESLVRQDVVAQAMLLAKSLLQNKRTQLPEVYALMALMCFHSARSTARLSPEGELVLLSRQDRSKWNAELIQMGNEYLNQAAFGSRISVYHFEAAIAYHHCVARDYDDTNWNEILKYYDGLLLISTNPVVFLNRCIVIMELEGAKAAMKLLKSDQAQSLGKYYLYHALFGELHYRLGEFVKAVQSFKEARKLTVSTLEQRFLDARVSEIVN